MKIQNYLAITFNFDDDTYKHNKKPNNKTKYIHVDSDHPPSVIKQISKSTATNYFCYHHQKKYFSKLHNLTNKTLQVAGTTKN